MSKESINKPNLKKNKVWGIVLPIVYNTRRQADEVLKQEPNFIEIWNWNRLLVSDLRENWDRAQRAAVDKYNLSPAEKDYFKEGLTRIITNAQTWTKESLWFKLKPDPEHPSRRWSSKVQCYADDNYSNFYLGAKIYINPKMIYDKYSFFAVAFHELDHYAYKIKKYSMKMNEIPKDQRRRLEMRIIEEDKKDYNKFATELLARVDTADELLWQGVDNDIVDRFGIWNENETTWEQLYTDSIKYAKKFFDFQKWLYNLLWNKFGRDSSKPKNKQLSKEAEKEFEDIMTHLRNIVFNCSIESTKKVIDAICHNFKEATKREQFKSNIQRIYSDITR